MSSLDRGMEQLSAEARGFYGNLPFLEYLEGEGFMIAPSHSSGKHNWYAYRKLKHNTTTEIPHCEDNEKPPSLLITPYRGDSCAPMISNSLLSQPGCYYQMEIYGMRKGVWHRLMKYGINLDMSDLERLGAFLRFHENSLIDAWINL